MRTGLSRDDCLYEMQCPQCEEVYAHHGAVQVFERDREDGPVFMLTPGSAGRVPVVGNGPSRRRGAVRIWFKGECGHGWAMDIIQSKGLTFIGLGHVYEMDNPDEAAFQ